MSSSSPSPSSSSRLPRVDFDKTETVGSTRWMRLESLSYCVPPKDAASTTPLVRKWDRAVRTTKQSEESVDAVVILAILKHDPGDPRKDEIVCVKQFRPPVDAYTVELPAGLIDAAEPPAVAAVREFREETGYIGKAAEVLPASYLSPGLTNESACVVRLEVDMVLDHNAKVHSGRIGNEELEESEKDRGLVKLLLPRVGLLEALNDLQEKEGVKVFAALYTLALGLSIGQAAATKPGGDVTRSLVGPAALRGANFPVVMLELDGNHTPAAATSRAVTSALRDSGFLIIKTSILPLELQLKALSAASQLLESPSSVVVTHPSDPKVYAMLQGIDSLTSEGNAAPTNPTIIEDLRAYYKALHKTKTVLLSCIAVGLGMQDSNFFVNLHDENNDALRLLKYPPGNEATGNRCKEHSDYGTLTLLLNDGVGGLEAFVDNEWRPVPYVEGGIVVNIGSILSQWTRQQLKATLHRVVGPASVGSSMSRTALLDAVARPRISIAYFVDPNSDVSAALLEGQCREEDQEKKESFPDDHKDISVSDYIQWRSGGEGASRSGVVYTPTEESRIGVGKSA